MELDAALAAAGEARPEKSYGDMLQENGFREESDANQADAFLAAHFANNSAIKVKQAIDRALAPSEEGGILLSEHPDLTKDVWPENLDWFSGRIRSREHGELIRKQVLERQLLAEKAGHLNSPVLRGVAAFSSPEIVASVGGGALINLAGRAATGAGRGANYLRAAGVERRSTFEVTRYAAGETAVADSVLAAADEDFTMVDALTNTLMAGAAGAALSGSIDVGSAIMETRRHARNLAAVNRLRDEGVELSDEAVEAEKQANKFFATEEFDPEAQGTAGLNTGTVAERLQNSAGAAAREAGNRLFKKQALQEGGTRRFSAEEIMAAEQEKSMAVFGQRFHAAKQRFQGSENELASRVSNHLRFGEDTDPVVRELAGQVRGEVLIPLGKRLRAAKVKGFETLSDEALNSYMIRQYHSSKVYRTMNDADIGREGIEALFTESVRRANPEFSEKFIKRLGQGIARKVMDKSHAGVTGRQVDGLDGDAVDLLDDISTHLQRLNSQDPAEVDAALAALRLSRDDLEDVIVGANKGQQADQGNIARGKIRSTLDERASVTLANGKTLAMTDLLEDNLKTLISKYTHSVTGPLALAETIGVRSRQDWDEYVKRIVDEEDATSQAAGQEALRTLEGARKHFYGESHLADPSSKWAQLSRIVGNATFSKMMTKLMVAMLPETASALSLNGFKAFAQAGLPLATKLTRRMRNGEFEDETARQIQSFTGLGSNELKRFPKDFVEDVMSTAVDEGGTVGAGLAKAEQVTAGIAQSVSKLSVGFDTLLRLGTANMFMHTFKRLADGEIVLGQKGLTEARLRQVGLNSETAEGIAKALRDPQIAVISKKSGQFEKLDLQKMRDKYPQDAIAFELATRDWVNRRIQMGDFGNTYLWMHGALGRLVMQFRSYPFQSINRQIQSELSGTGFGAGKDFGIAKLMLGTAAMGTLGYTASQFLLHGGAPDFQEKMGEAMEPGNLAFNGLRRSMIFALPLDVAFGAFRGYGAPSSALIGLPGLSLFDDAAYGMGDIASGVSEGNAADVLNGAGRMLQIRNVLGIGNALNILESMVSGESLKPKGRTDSGRVLRDSIQTPSESAPGERVSQFLDGLDSTKEETKVDIETNFVTALKEVENGSKTGFRNGKWYPHKSPEGGTDTIAYGHKLTHAEEVSGSFVGGITEQQADVLFRRDFKKHEEGAKRETEAHGVPWASLPRKYQLVLTNIHFNVGTLNSKKTGKWGWPSLMKHMANGDDAGVRKEMVTSFTGGPLKTRARKIADSVGLDK